MHTSYLLFLSNLLLTTAALFSSLSLNGATQESITPEIALKKLLEGNSRYVQDKLEHPNRDQDRRDAVYSKQLPFATILGCSDSRVSPEIIFDQGIGDLFVVRLAGNVVGAIGLDSIEYSIDHLHSSLIFVLGHANCGAVSAVLAGKTKDIEAIAAKIEPAVIKSKTLPGNALVNAIKANVEMVVNEIRQSKTIAPLIKAGKVDVAGGYYNLESGRVELCCGTQKDLVGDDKAQKIK